MKRSSWLPFGLIVTLGLLLGMLGFSIWEKTPSPVERVAWAPEAQWIAPQSPTYRFYARHTFYLPDKASAGWLRISADNDFTLYVNGRQIARENSVLNNSLGLTGGVRIPFQDFNDSNRYRVKTSVNYLLASSNDWKLTAYVDLTSFLRPGKNVIALEIQKGKQNPRVVAEGVVYPVADVAPINLTTGVTDWRVSNLSETRRAVQWYDVGFPDAGWAQAKILSPIQEATYSRLSKNLFDRPLAGNWITGTPSQKGQVWLRGIWFLPQTPISHAYIRFAGKGQYSILLNGTLVNDYRTESGQLLHLLEVTKLLRPGNNILAVSLASPLEAARAGNNQVNSNGSVDWLLDGWAETDKAEIVSSIASDSTWRSFNNLTSNWEKGVGEGQTVTLMGLPDTQQFRRNFEGNAYLLNYPKYLWHLSLWQLAGVVCALLYAFYLGLWFGRETSWCDTLSIGAAILTPGTLFLIGIALLKHRYAEAESGLLFAQPQSNYLILIGFTTIFLLTLLLSQIRNILGKLPRRSLWFFFGVVVFTANALVAGGNVILTLLVATVIIGSTRVCVKGQQQIKDIFTALPTVLQSSGQWVLLAFIVSIGFALRAYNLDTVDLDADENTSFDAARGILRTGAPISTSGIWYTRGPFYQYLLALWLRLVGDSAVNARFLSVLWGTATLIIFYIFARKLTGKIWIALFVTLILAINPWELWYSRNIRFYQVLQCLTILSLWSFCKSFIEKSGKLYQYIFFVSLTLTLLTQEISLTILPAFIIGFLYFYRPFQLSKEWQIVVGTVITLSVFIYCLAFSYIRLLTPLAAISDSTSAYLQLHFSDITDLFANFLFGSARMQIIYTLFFFIGCIYFLKTRNTKLLFWSITVLTQVMIVTILCYNLAERYVYSVYPLFLLIAIYSAIDIAETQGNKIQQLLENWLNLRAIALSFVIIIIVINLEPPRVLAAYHESINRRNIQVFEYITNQKQTDDVVISPLPSLAVVSLGKLDYFLMGTGYFDAIYWHQGKLIDRWAGAVVVTNIDQVNRIFEKSKRVWIHLEDTREGRFSPDTWQYMESLGQPVIDSFGTRLRLWQPENGLPNRIPNNGKDLGAY